MTDFFSLMHDRATAFYDGAHAADLRVLPPTNYCDKRHLQPLHDLPRWLEAECHKPLDPARVEAMLTAGWIPRLLMADGTLGFAAYLPTRIALYLELEGAGWSATELTVAAETEESLIDDVLVAPDTPYEDDDHALVRIGLGDEIDAYRGALQSLADGRQSVVEGEDSAAVRDRLQQKLQSAERVLAFFERTPFHAMKPSTQAKVAKHAFQLRHHFDMVRQYMIEKDRARLRAGFSTAIVASATFDPCAEPSLTITEIQWAPTVRQHAALCDAHPDLPLRVPGLCLLGDQVTMTRTIRPADYERLWARYQLRDYLHARAALDGAALCLACDLPLPLERPANMRFCSANCRTNHKAARYRDRHPERVKASRVRYLRNS